MALATLKYTIQIWQMSNLHDVPIQECFWGNEVFRHCREYDVLDLPFDRPVLGLLLPRLLTVAGSLCDSDQRFGDIEISELSEKSLETLYLRRPVHLEVDRHHLLAYNIL